MKSQELMKQRVDNFAINQNKEAQANILVDLEQCKLEHKQQKLASKQQQLAIVRTFCMNESQSRVGIISLILSC